MSAKFHILLQRAAQILPESFPNEPRAQGENTKSLLHFGESTTVDTVMALCVVLLDLQDTGVCTWCRNKSRISFWTAKPETTAEEM